MPERTVVVVDYGLGNLFSIRHALAAVGARVVVSGEPEPIARAGCLVLPGVGAFAEGMKGLRERGLVAAIRDFAASGRPLLGVCLGMQMLMSRSEEHGRHEGLDLVPGDVVRLREAAEGGARYKLPHIGWSELEAPDGSGFAGWGDSILRGLPKAPFMYFLHSYRVVPASPDVVLATTLYGRDRFCSVLRAGNVVGCQGHPERSGSVGLRILANLVAG